MQTFLGQRYGSRPLPATIHHEEMEHLFQIVKEHSSVTEEDQRLLQSWYVKDENAVPPEYVLQPISEMARAPRYFEDEESYAAAAGEKVDPQMLWKQVEPRLSQALRKAASVCKQQGRMSEEEAHKYFMSGLWQVSALYCCS